MRFPDLSSGMASPTIASGRSWSSASLSALAVSNPCESLKIIVMRAVR